MTWPSLASELLALADTHRLGVTLLPEDRASQIRERVMGAWRKDRRRRLLWEQLAGSSVQDPEGWRRIPDYVGDAGCVLFFDESTCDDLLAVPSGAALRTLLEESYHFEFYVTGTGDDYVLAFNHHDFLVGAGSAEAFVERLRRRT